MRSKAAGLQNVLSIGSYLKNETSVFGRAYQKNISGVDVIGPPLTHFIDYQTEVGVLPAGPMHATANGRIFVLSAITLGQASLILYDFNLATGVHDYVGRVLVNFAHAPATTHTQRFIRAFDSGVTGWKIFIGTVGTGTNAIVNGGTAFLNNMAKADFVKVSPPTIGLAITSNAKAVYSHREPALFGQANSTTALVAGGLYDSELLCLHGTAAALTMHGLDLTQTPTLNIQTVTTPGGSAVWTAAGHGFNVNDPVVLTTTGTIPAGFTASTTTAQTVYFVRNPAANTFELSATFGGASITATTAGTGTHSVLHAFGQTSSMANASRKTGTVTALTGQTLLLTDSGQVTVPFDGPNAGQNSFFYMTSTNMFTWRLTDITAGATSFPTMDQKNLLGTGTDVTAIAATHGKYSASCGVAVYASTTFNLLMKRMVNSALFAKFGGQSNTWYEGTMRITDSMRTMTMVGLETESGWLFISSSLIGQRGILVMDMRSDQRFDFSYVTSPVFEVAKGSLKFITSLEQLFETTDSIKVEYRTAATYADALFNSATGGWIEIGIAEDLSSLTLERFVQLRLSWDIVTDVVSTPAQVNDLILGYQDDLESSLMWSLSQEFTSREAEAPIRSVAYLNKAYLSGTVPKITMKAISKASGLVVYQKDTVANAAEFTYSTDNYLTQNPLGTIPNVAGTLLTHNWTSPIPGDCDIVWSDT
jgi:hypothetical protein